MKATILNVNDNDISRYTLTETLKRAGYTVVEARGGREALTMSLQQPDLIVLDVRLPDLDGFEVCRRIRKQSATAKVKVLHTSATFVSMDKRVQGLEAGADAYLTQPFEREELLAIVSSLLKLAAVEKELEQRAARLADADRRKDEFLAMLAHELRNPLTAITASLPLLDRRPPGDPVESRARQVLHRQTQHLQSLVADLLDVSRVTQGKITLQSRQIDLTRLVRDVCEDFRTLRMRDTSQTLHMSVPESPVMVKGDDKRIEQVLTNLLDNACKYTNATGNIEVSLERHGNQAMLIVRDDGVGIEPSSINTLFTLFAQDKTTIDRTRGGLGIGLTLAKHLVELHGGEISCRSGGLGKGSEFTVRLPVGDISLVAVEPVLEKLSTQASRRVLIVDDNEDARETLADLCEALGHKVLKAGDGLSAVKVATTEHPDIAIVDIGLPGIDGYEAARRIRASTPHTYLIALTGYGATEAVLSSKQAGFDRHIVKPIDFDVLRSLLAHSSA